MKQRTLLSVLGVLLFSFYGHAQTPPSPPSISSLNSLSTLDSSNTRVSTSRRIRFNGKSGTEEIKIEVKKNTERLHLSIRSSVEKGSIEVKLYDPSGQQQGQYKIETQLDSDIKERVSGNINKSLKQPQHGIWVVKITVKSATGNVNLNTSFIE